MSIVIIITDTDAASPSTSCQAGLLCHVAKGAVSIVPIQTKWIPHFHVNPFQIVEVFDPKKMSQPQKLSPPYVWWDTFAIPPRATADGPVGYFKMRSRFADFTGKFVIHCHILGHEDRGMMQVVEVIPKRKLNIAHH